MTAGYEIIYTDPPWPLQKGNPRKCRPNQTKELDYNTLSFEDCFTVQDAFFAKAADRHNVFMWTIEKYLHETEQAMADRGYALHTRMIWDKQNGVAPAYTVRFCHEYLLWFYKPGKILLPVDDARGKFSTVIREASTYHSHKPKKAYEMIETMFPDAVKIELFARNRRYGWESWGNQVDGAEPPPKPSQIALPDDDFLGLQPAGEIRKD